MDMQSNNLPTKQKGMSYRARLFSRLGFIIACVSLFPGVICSGVTSFTPSTKTGNFWDDTFPIILLFAILGGAIFAIIKFRSSWNTPISVTPSREPIASDRLGEIFEVWYQETIKGFHFGTGTIVFQENEILLESHLFPGMLYSLLNQQQGEKVSTKVAYSGVTGVSIKELHIILHVKTSMVLMPQIKVTFYVSEIDAKRIHKELEYHFQSRLENK